MVNSSRKISAPITITSTPPATSSTGISGRILRMPVITLPSARPVIRNGTPNPSDHADSSTVPFATVPDDAASVRIAPRIGPMHGVHPTANADPMPNDFPYRAIAGGALRAPDAGAFVDAVSVV